MSTPLLLILSVGAAIGCWAVLTLMGGERARRLNQLQAQRPATPPPTPVLSVPASAVGVAQASTAVKPKSAKPQAARDAGKNVR